MLRVKANTQSATTDWLNTEGWLFASVGAVDGDQDFHKQCQLSRAKNVVIVDKTKLDKEWRIGSLANLTLQQEKKNEVKSL